MNYNKIKNIALEKGISIRALTDKIGMSEGGFYNAIKNNTLTIKALEKIAEVLGVAVTVFFDENTTPANQELLKKIAELENTIKEDKEWISILKTHINLIQEGKIPPKTKS